MSNGRRSNEQRSPPFSIATTRQRGHPTKPDDPTAGARMEVGQESLKIVTKILAAWHAFSQVNWGSPFVGYRVSSADGFLLCVLFLVAINLGKPDCR